MSEKKKSQYLDAQNEDQKVSFRSVKKEDMDKQNNLQPIDSDNKNLQKIIDEQQNKDSILNSNMSGEFSRKSARDNTQLEQNKKGSRRRSSSKKLQNSKTSNMSNKSKRSQRQNQRSQRSTRTALLSEKKRAQRYEKREEIYSTNLNQFVSLQTQNPFNIIQKNYRQKRLKFFFNDPDDQKTRSFLTLDSIQKFKKSKTEKDQTKYINFMVEILKEENIDMHYFRVFTQNKKIKKHLSSLNFQQQQGQDIYLQKKQKTFGGFVYRSCFITDTSFGQIKKDKNAKPQYFIENECQMQTKDDVKKLREDKEKKKKVFQWADKKECKDYQYRLQFTNLQSKKIICVYFADKNQCQNLKNLIIFQKKKHKDPYFKKKISVFINNWRVKQAGFFHGKILRRFFSSANSIQEIANQNQFLKDKLNEYQQLQGEQLEEIPEEYDNNQEQVQVIDFQNQNPSYIKKQQAINLDQSQSLFVSMIDKISYRRIDTSQKKIQFDLQKTNANFKISNEIIQGLKLQIYKNSIPNDLNEQFKEKIIKSSLVLVRLKNINLQYKDQQTNDSELFKISIDQKENQSNFKKGISIQRQNSKNLIQSDISKVVNLNILKEFKILIISENNNKEILSQNVNIFQSIKSFDYSNYITVDVDCQDNEQFSIIQLFFQIIIVPKNLEISHLLMPSFIIQNNLNSFGELIEQTYSYTDFFNIFYSEQVTAFFQQISSDQEFLGYLYNPIAYESIQQSKNFSLYINYLQKSSLVIDLLEVLFKEELTLQNIFENVGFAEENQNIQSQIIKRINNGCSSYERSFISMIIIQQFSFLKKNNSNKLKYSIVEITYIEEQINKFLIQKAYLTAQEKFRFFKLVLELYNDFQNYELNEKQIRVYFSINYLDLIYNAMVNNSNVKDQQIKKIICSDIFVSIDFTQYSQNQILIHFNKILQFIKFIFKFLMPENFENYIQNSIIIDQHVLQFLMTNFSSVQHQSFMVLSDFKKIFSLIFYQKYPDIIEIMDALNITLFNYFDMMLILSALIFIKKDIEQISNKNKLNFQNLLLDAFNHPEELISIQIKLYQKLQQENFFFNQLQKINNISKIQSQKEAIFLKLREDIYNLEINKDEIKSIFEKYLLQSQNFIINIKQMFNIIENQFEPVINDNLIQQTNPYFEILDEFDEFINILESNNEINENFMLELILNGIDGKFARKLNKKEQNQDLGQICKFDQEHLAKIFNFQRDNIEIFNEVIDSLKLMYQSEQIPLFDVLVIIILQKYEQADQNEFFIEILKLLSKKFLINSQEQIAIEFYLHIKKLIYLFSFQNFNYIQEANKIRQSQQKQLDCISEATLFIQNQAIDVTTLCNAEFIGFKFSTGKYGMHFDSNFCKQLCLIFEDLIRKEAINTKQRDQKFNLNIVRTVYQVKSYFNVQFKIIFGDEIKILCLQHEPIYFQQILSDQSLVDTSYIIDDLQHLSINLFCKQYDLEKILDLKKLNFEIIFESINTEFLKINAQFDEQQHLQIYNRITTWEYQKNETEQDDLMNLEFEDLNIKIPYFFLFMKTGYFIKYLQQLLVSQIKIENIIGFIKLNTDRYQILNEKDKVIEPNTMIILIKNFQEKIENDSLFKLKISYKY